MSITTGLQYQGNDIGSVFATIASLGNYGSPPGSVISYLGTNDITGWIICDGVTRSNNSDGKYNILNSMGIGSGGSNTSNYTPPNLKNRFLCSLGLSSLVGLTGGNDTVTLTTSNMPSHSHSGTTDGQSANHTHDTYSPAMDININQGNGSGSGSGQNRDFNPKRTTTSTSSNESADHRHSFISNSVGGGNSFSILPPYYSINYIIKY